MEEIWKPVVGYERLYEVSNLGNVRSLNYNRKGEIKKLAIQIDGGGYHYVSLCSNGKVKKFLIHKLVMSAFIGEPPIDKPEVNHIDEDKSNNCISNLHYCSRKFNANYSYTWKKAIDVTRKPVLQFTKDGEFIAEYESVRESERQTGIKRHSIICCCKGELKTAGNYKWKYKTDE